MSENSPSRLTHQTATGVSAHLRLLVMLLVVALVTFWAPLSVAKGRHGSHSSTKTHKAPKVKIAKAPKAPKAPKVAKAPKGKTENSDKTVHVKGYTRKDGTYVAPYDRAASGTDADTRSTGSGSRSVSENSAVGGRDKHGKVKRSEIAKHDFMLLHPCPATGLTTGKKCTGYVIDHVNPLKCGGADAPGNMQWQTKADAKAKDKWERKGCR